MQNNDEPEGTTNEHVALVNPTQENVLDGDSKKAEERRQTREGNAQGVFGQLRKRLPTIVGTRWRTIPRTQVATNVSTDAHEEISTESSQSEDVLLDLAKWVRRLLIPLSLLAWASIIILLLWGASHITRAILLLVVASLLAYALAPLVTLFARVVPRFLAILFVYLIVLGGVGALIYLVVRTTVDQITSLSGYLGFLLTPTNGQHQTAVEQTLRSFGISSSQIASIRTQIILQSQGLAGDIVPLITGVVNASLDILLVAVLSVYLLVDGSRATRWFRHNMPRRQKGRVRFLLETLQRIVGGYIRGQLLLCSIVGVLVGAGMQVLGVPYAILLGVLAFVLEFIPILGTLVSGAICVLLALTKGGWVLSVIVLVYFVVVHVIEGDVVGPRIVGKAIGLHPVVALLALIVGGDLFGIWGALFASPIAGVLQAFLIAVWSEWREMHPGEFQKAKDKIVETVENNVAEKSIDLEPAAKLLSDEI